MVSVVIPCFNPGRRLHDAIASVRSGGLAAVELIVVDDGSSPPLQLEERILRQVNAGPAAARNTGWRAAAGEFIAFLDADDLWKPGSLSALLAALQGDPEAGVAQGRVVTVRPPNPADPPGYRVNLGACLFRRSTLESLGGFDESLRFGEDTDFFIRCWHAGLKKVRIHDTVLVYQLHASNMTARAPTYLRTLATLAQRQARRRREGLPERPGSGLVDYLGWEEEWPAGGEKGSGHAIPSQPP